MGARRRGSVFCLGVAGALALVASGSVARAASGSYAYQQRSLQGTHTLVDELGSLRSRHALQGRARQWGFVDSIGTVLELQEDATTGTLLLTKQRIPRELLFLGFLLDHPLFFTTAADRSEERASGQREYSLRAPNGKTIRILLTYRSERGTAPDRTVRVLATATADFDYAGDDRLYPGRYQLRETLECEFDLEGELASFQRLQKVEISPATDAQTQVSAFGSDGTLQYENLLRILPSNRAAPSPSALRRPQTASGSPFLAGPLAYVTADYIECIGDSSFRVSTSSFYEMTTDHAPEGWIRYRFFPRGYGIQMQNQEEATALYTDDPVKPITVFRDPLTQRLQGEQVEALALEANVLFRESVIRGGDSPGQDLLPFVKEYDDTGPRLGRLSLDVEEVPASTGPYKDLTLFRYQTKPQVVDLGDRAGTGTVSVSGVSVVDIATGVVLHDVWTYLAEIRGSSSGARSYATRSYSFACDPETGLPLLPVDSLSRLRDLLETVPAPGREDIAFEGSPPEWFAEWFHAERSTRVAAAITCERRTNPIPILAIVAVVFTVDGLIENGSDLFNDGKFNQNGFSPLRKYFFRPAVMGWWDTLDIDPRYDRYQDNVIDGVHLFTSLAVSTGSGMVRHGPSWLMKTQKALRLHSPTHWYWGKMAHVSVTAQNWMRRGRDLYDNIDGIVRALTLIKVGRLAADASTDEPPPNTVPEPHGWLQKLDRSAAVPYILAGTVSAVAIGGIYYLATQGTSGGDGVPGPGDDDDNGTGGLSDVIVDSPQIRITVYDHQLIDGDIIDLSVNDQALLTNFTLPGPPGRTLDVRLRPGKNKVTIQARNEGSIPPNTATIEISNVVSGEPEQVWQLGMGQNASFSIAYQTQVYAESLMPMISSNRSVALGSPWGTAVRLGIRGSTLDDLQCRVRMSWAGGRTDITISGDAYGDKLGTSKGPVRISHRRSLDRLHRSVLSLDVSREGIEADCLLGLSRTRRLRGSTFLDVSARAAAGSDVRFIPRGSVHGSATFRMRGNESRTAVFAVRSGRDQRFSVVQQVDLRLSDQAVIGSSHRWGYWQGSRRPSQHRLHLRVLSGNALDLEYAYPAHRVSASFRLGNGAGSTGALRSLLDPARDVP